MRNLCLAIILFFTSSFGLASEPETELHLFGGFWKNVGDSFTGKNILFHLSGFAATPILISSGIDSRVYDTFRQGTNDATWPGAVAGSGVGALAAGLWLYYSGEPQDHKTVGAAYVIAQASLITVSYVTLMKALTGRAHPTNTSTLTSREQSEQFQFGFVRSGTGYGWPSGHVSHTVAVTSALANYYPDKTWLTWFSLGVSSYMLYTVSAFHSGQMHWFSDGVAGAFSGYAIGSTVGRNMRQSLAGENPKDSRSIILPVIGPNFLALMGQFEF